MSDRTPLRRLRFEYQVRAGESVIGAVAAACRGHVLGTTLPVLREAGIHPGRPGLVQLAPRDRITALAHVIRADPEALAATAGERVHGTTIRDTHQRVVFGDLTLLRSDLDLATRRVSPLALALADFHRAQWLNSLLPFCPETLERLVDRCATCGGGLGWREAWGVGVCEHCRTPLAPSAEPPLDRGLVDDYRLFAKMVSPVPGDRLAAREVLPERLRDADWATLLRLGVKLAMLCVAEPTVGLRQSTVRALEERARAALVARAAGILRTWPVGVRRWFDGEASERSHDHLRFRELKAGLVRSFRDARSKPVLRDLVEEALPELGKRVELGFAPFSRSYNGIETAMRLKVQRKALKPLVQAQRIVHRAIKLARRTQVQFDADDVDRIAARYADTTPIRTFAAEFRLPIYAVEQLCCHGAIAWEDDPAVRLLRNQLLLRASSLTRFKGELVDRASARRRPPDAVGIIAAMTRFGGKGRPWGAVFEAMLERSLEYWLSSGSPNCETIMLCPRELGRFDGIAFSRDRYPAFPFEKRISQMDAEELVGLAVTSLAPVMLDRGFRPVKRVKAQTFGIEDVEGLAGEMVRHFEITWHSGLPSRRVSKEMRRKGIPKVHAGWCRRSVIEAGIIPRLER